MFTFFVCCGIKWLSKCYFNFKTVIIRLITIQWDSDIKKGQVVPSLLKIYGNTYIFRSCCQIPFLTDIPSSICNILKTAHVYFLQTNSIFLHYLLLCLI